MYQVVDTQLRKLRKMSRLYPIFTEFPIFTISHSRVFYTRHVLPYCQGYRPVTPLDAARVNSIYIYIYIMFVFVGQHQPRARELDEREWRRERRGCAVLCVPLHPSLPSLVLSYRADSTKKQKKKQPHREKKRKKK